MCFGGAKQAKPETPAPAPPPAAKPPEEIEMERPGAQQDEDLYGDDRTPTRIEKRTAAPIDGGAGLNMK